MVYFEVMPGGLCVPVNEKMLRLPADAYMRSLCVLRKKKKNNNNQQLFCSAFVQLFPHDELEQIRDRTKERVWGQL